jgi:hypothetical protein
VRKVAVIATTVLAVVAVWFVALALPRTSAEPAVQTEVAVATAVSLTSSDASPVATLVEGMPSGGVVVDAAAVAAAAAAAAEASATAASRPKPKVYVFFLPHQDDEMFMAGSIREHLTAGDDVQVVQVTSGQSSMALSRIMNSGKGGKPVFCDVHKRYHDPIAEHYQDPVLTPRLFSAARNREFMASMASLGVPKERIHFANDEVPAARNHPGETWVTGWSNPRYSDDGSFERFADGSPLQKVPDPTNPIDNVAYDVGTVRATEVLDYYYGRFGPGVYATTASYDMKRGIFESNYSQSEHLALRRALGDYRGDMEKVFYSDRPVPAETRTIAAAAQAPRASALRQYLVWEPTIGRYATGLHSTSKLLNQEITNPYEYVIRSR